MPIKIKDIPGALVDTKDYKTHGTSDYAHAFHEGIKFLKIKQGEVSIGLNREKLAKVIHTATSQQPWEECKSRDYQYRLSQAILAKEQEIIEVKE